MPRHSISVALLVGVTLLLQTPAQAGVIVSVLGSSSPGVGSSAHFGAPNATTTNPNNDNSAVQSPNFVPLAKGFAGVGPYDLSWTVRNSGTVAPGTTEYLFDETNPTADGSTGVLNLSGVTWTDFHFELGFGLGANFVQANPTTGLDFDSPNMDPTPTASNFTVLNQQVETIDWSGGSILNGQKGFFTFSVDVPDWSAAIPAGFEQRDAQGNIIGYTFTLRETPSVGTTSAVPEPGSLSIFAMGLFALAGFARRTRKQAP